MRSAGIRARMKRLLVFAVWLGMSVFFISGAINSGMASELIYVPVNPSFGGSSFNAAWLMQQAQVQDMFKAPPVVRPRSDPLQTFSDTLTRQVLGRLSSRIIEAAFGEEALGPGEYTVGNYKIVITSEADALNVAITDLTTGGMTSVEIPYY